MSITTKPRIWDEFKHKPHLYVYADAATNEDRYMRDRYAMCYALAEFMNGGERPAWLDDFHRIGETSLESLSGAKIFATGPSIDRNPPRLDWIQDDSDECRDDRARLIDALTMEQEP